MTSKKIDKLLREIFGKKNVKKINVSGCPFMSRGIVDYYIHNRKDENDFGFWIETKTPKDKRKKRLQEEFLRLFNGYKLESKNGKSGEFFTLSRYYEKSTSYLTQKKSISFPDKEMLTIATFLCRALDTKVVMNKFLSDSELSVAQTVLFPKN